MPLKIFSFANVVFAIEQYLCIVIKKQMRYGK